MKKVIFDIDGVLLSEERYFDVSGLTVWEILFSPKYMGLPAEQDDFDAARVSEGEIASCRAKVWDEDRGLSFLKAHGLNSNWDMVHAWLITALWLMAETYEKRSGGEKLRLSFHKPEDFQEAGQLLMGLPIPSGKDVLARWQAVIPADVEAENVIATLKADMAPHFEGNCDWADLRSDFWNVHTKAFQAWYLGDDVYITLNHAVPYSGGKPGFLTRESPLASSAAILLLFQTLKKDGYDLAVATGRAREEVDIPFRQFHWLEEFDPLYMATASDAVDAAHMLGGPVLDKPHPFIFSCAIFGRKPENYKAYAAETMKPGAADEIYVCGDSYSDLLGARAAGARFIGVLTGLNPKESEEMFGKAGVPMVKNITGVAGYLESNAK